MTRSSAQSAQSIPANAGIGLRAEHYQDVLDTRPAVGWLEVHSENYFGAGGRPLRVLERLRGDYPLSFHGVGLSLGSTDPLSAEHLRRLRELINRFEPGLVSEHLAWTSAGGIHLNDLLPLPYTEEALIHFVSRVVQAQDYLGRRLLIENPSTYLTFVESRIPEHEFLIEVARRSGCGILLDVNNVFVSARNHGLDAAAYLDGIPAGLVEEIHLAGHVRNRFEDGEILIDSHSRPVAAEVWRLYGRIVTRLGRRPTLIEWDADLPPLDVLVGEADRAERILVEHGHALAS